MIAPQEQESEDEYYDRMARSLEDLRDMLVLAEERYLQHSLHRLVPVYLVEAALSAADTATEELPDVEVLDDIEVTAQGSAPAEARPHHAIPPTERQ
jgi:hypothetical protein